MGLLSFNNGNYGFQSIDEALTVIKTHSLEIDEIWVSDKEKYPCVAVCTNGEYAAVTYFGKEEGDMYLSFNVYNQIKVDFTAGGEEWIPEPDAVISKDKAIECIKEFLETGNKPECIKWQSL